MQGLEKYIMTKLHNWAFGQSAADRERDEILQQRMQALEFVRPVHLEIPDAYQDVSALDMAMAELRKIDHFKVSCMTTCSEPLAIICMWASIPCIAVTLGCGIVQSVGHASGRKLP